MSNPPAHSQNDPGTLPAAFHLGPEHQGPVVFITAVVLVICTLLSTIARLAEIPAKKRRATLADAIIVLANLIAIAHCVAITLAVRYGLGDHLATSPDLPRLRQFDDALYTAQLLSMVTQACAKGSVIALGDILNPHWNRVLRRVSIIAVVCWGLFAVFALSFDCGIPGSRIYSAKACYTKSLAIQLTIGITNAVTDAYLALFMLPAICRLKMQTGVRFMLALLFAPRILVCIPQIATIAFLPSTLATDDQTWSETPLAILTQVTIALSIITANLPSMKRLLYALQTGQSGTRLTERQEAQLQLNGSRGWTRHTNGPSTISTPTTFSGSKLLPRSKNDSTQATDTERNDGGQSPTWPAFSSPQNANPHVAFWRNVDVHVEVEVKVEVDGQTQMQD